MIKISVFMILCLPLSLSLSLSLSCSPIDSPTPADKYSLFHCDADQTKGRWLEGGHTLAYYHLKNGVSH